jgi:hypothetical protein
VLALKNQNRILRFSSTIPTSASNEIEWKNAKTFDQIPGPSTFGMMRAFLPGGS